MTVIATRTVTAAVLAPVVSPSLSACRRNPRVINTLSLPPWVKNSSDDSSVGKEPELHTARVKNSLKTLIHLLKSELYAVTVEKGRTNSVSV